MPLVRVSNGGTPQIGIAWGKNAGTDSQFTRSAYDHTMFTLVNSNNKTHTITFLTDFKGYLGAIGCTISGTCTRNAISNASGTYTDKLYTVTATAGQTLKLVVQSNSWPGYELIGVVL